MRIHSTLVDVLQDAAQEQTGITFIRSSNDELTYSYQELLSKALYTLYNLQEFGVNSGDEVIIQINDNADFLQVFWACILGKIIPVPVAIGRQEGHKHKLYNIWKKLDNPFLVCDKGLLEEMFTDRSDEETETAYQKIAKTTLSSTDAVLEKIHGSIDTSIHSEDIAYIQFSSGSTGNPKGVVLTHANLVANITDIANRSEITAADRSLSWLPLTHDMGLICFHLSSTLRKIQQFLLPTTLFIRRPLLWMDKASEHKASLLYSPNFGCQYILSAIATAQKTIDWNLSNVRIMYNGAEPISWKLCNQFLEEMSQFQLPSSILYPGYGLAEACVAVTLPIVGDPFRCYFVDRNHLKIGDKIVEVESANSSNSTSFVEVGRPIDQCPVRIANDIDEVLADKHIGHIQIKGANVTTGYYNDPEVSADCKTKDYWHRTGDLGFMYEGALVITGRAKNLIIINGQNIYPQDIEEIIHRKLHLKPETVVACSVRKDVNDSEKLLIFIQQRRVSEDFIQTILDVKREVLNELNLEVHQVIAIKSVPKTTSGKVQHYQLVQQYLKGDYEAQIQETNELEQQLTHNEESNANSLDDKLWSIAKNILKNDALEFSQNFFTDGFNSLKATALLSRIHQLGYQISIETLFKNASVAELSQYLKNEELVHIAQIQVSNLSDKYPLTSGQKRFWMLHQFNQNTAAHITSVSNINGNFNPTAFSSAMRSIVDRHDSLRTVFRTESGEVYQQVIPSASFNFEVGVLDFSTEPAPEALAKSRAFDLANCSFDLSEGPLLRVELIKISESQYYFIFIIHHIISDGWSIDIISKELQSLYKSYSLGNESLLAPLRLQYKDYVAWYDSYVSTASYEASREYWLNRFSGELPSLELPFSKNGGDSLSFSGAYLHHTFSKEISKALKELCASHHVTTFTGIMSVLSSVFYHLTGNTDIIIGTDTAGRIHQDLEAQVGYYLNLLPIRIGFSNENSFTELLSAVHQELLAGYSHQSYPFDALIAELGLPRIIGKLPLLDVLVLFQNFENALGFNDLIEEVSITSQAIETPTSLNDLLLEFKETGDALSLTVRYNTAVYTTGQLEVFIASLENVLSKVAADPTQAIESFGILSDSEQAAILSFSKGETKHYGSASIIDLFRQQAAKAPQSKCLTYQGESLNYQQVEERSNQLADQLVHDYNVKSGDLVGLLTDRGFDMIIGMLGVLKSGAAYVPIDREYPVARQNYLIEASGLAVLVTSSNVEVATSVSVLELNTAQLSKYSSNYTGITPGKDGLAYLMYTSGTTGNPKGVEISHDSLLDYTQTFIRYFELTANDVVLQQSSFCFDTSVEEIYPILSVGGELILTPFGGKDVETLLDLTEKHKATVLSSTPLVIQSINELLAGKSIPSLRIVISGGDALKLEYVSNFPSQVKLYNTYGPTEGTVCTSYYEIEKTSVSNCIGSPIFNREIYICNDRLEMQPMYVIGELYLGGKGIALGYHNEPELTAANFIENPFGEGKLYRTGDSGYWDAFGNIHFIGRKDHQLKVRGYRVEAMEVARAIIGFEGVTDSHVMGCKSYGVQHLVGYFTGKSTEKALREYLRNELPDYMVPTYLVAMESFPMTANGKIAADKLPDPVSILEKEYQQARNGRDQKLIGIWETVLQANGIGITDNFFELGGHSLKAVQIANRIQEEFSVAIGLKEIFLYPVLKEQSDILATMEESLYEPIPVAAVQDGYPLSYAQRRLWFLDQLNDSSIAYNIPFGHWLKGSLNIEALSYAFNELIKRHESLRTVFQWKDEEVKQYVKAYKTTDFVVESINLENTTKDDETLVDTIFKEYNTAFNLSEGPLLKVYAFKRTEEKYFLFINMHHIIADEISVQILISELQQLYNAKINGNQEALNELIIHYKDFAVWQQIAKEQEESNHKYYWLEKLSGEITPLDLPTCFPRTVQQTFKGKRTQYTFEKGISKKFHSLLEQQDSSLFMGVLSLVKMLLYRYTGTKDIIIGTPISGRVHPDLENQVGFYLNTLALRDQVSGDISYEALLTKVKQTCLEAYEYQSYPFDLLVQELETSRDLSRSPLFDVMVVLEDMERFDKKLSFSDITIEGEYVDEETSKFDITFYFSKRNDDLHLTIEYNTSLFSASRMSRMASHLGELLELVVASPQTSIGKYNYLSGVERTQILEDFNATAKDYPLSGNFLAAYEQNVSKNPQAVAVYYADRQLSYGELDAAVNQLANYLKDNCNIKQGDCVGLLLDRSEWMLISMLSILKLGGIYLPIDKSYPTSRISYILEDGRAALLISDAEYKDESGISVMILPEKINELSAYSSELASVSVNEEDLAYMIYTSGSTGTPKGVKIRHKSVTNLMYAMEAEVSANASDSLLAVTTYAFDMSVVELFLPLHVGASVIIASTPSLKSPEAIIALFDKHEPTIMQATPGFWQMLVDAGWEGSDRVRVITGGEALSLSLGESLINYSETIWNMYGPTETTVYSTYKKVKATQDIQYIGRPVDNMQSYILDEELQLVPIGVIGTLYMSGAGIAVGYQNKEELTAKCFINHPYQQNTVMYNTGDLCSWNEEGSIKYYGRIDHQIKIRGYRIELEEIISAMLSYEGLQQGVVVGTEIGGEKHLAGYYTGEGIQSDSLRRHLVGCLPEYMIPTYLIGIEKFPLTPNGKIDKRALPNPSEEIVREYVAPTNEIERVLISIWEEVLGKEGIGIKDNFFELGGHSLKGIQIVSRIYKIFSKKVELKNIFMYPVLGDLADLIINGDFEEYTPITKTEQQEYYSPSYSQKRIWILEKLEASGEVYNMPHTYWLQGDLDKDLLKRTFETIIERHEVFRTIFVETIEEPRQKIVPFEEIDFEIDYVDLRNEQEPKNFAVGLAQNASQEIFDLGEDLLIKVSLYQTADNEYLFLFNIHHIIGDEWSLQILNKEIISIYNAYSKGEDHQLPVLNIQYKDFAAWQQNELSGENLQRHKDYWMEKLGGDTQSLDLTTDLVRPPSRKFNGDRLYFKIDAETTKKFQKILSKENSTLFMGLLTLVKAMLIRYTGNEELIVGTAITGRSHTDLEDQIGFYSNTLAFKSEYKENDSFLSFLQTVKTTVLEAFDHRIYPFDKLVDDLNVIRDLSRSPLIDIMVVLQDANAGDESVMAFNGMQVEETNVQMPISKFDLSYYFRERDGELIMTVEYDTDIFFKERVEKMGSHVIQLLSSIVDNPIEDIYELNYLKKEEEQLLLSAYAGKGNIKTPIETLSELFEKQVVKHGDRIAVVDGEYQMTYKELNEKANQLAQYLKVTYGAKPEDVIGIITEHNKWLVISILAIAKTGAAYLPINAKSPIDRINYQLEDAGVQLVLTDYFEEKLCTETFSVAKESYLFENYPVINIENKANTNNLAYVIYTSGSTGKPKGVMIEQAGLINLCEWHTEYYGLTRESRVSMYASISFDASVWEFWPAILQGAAVYMAAEKQETGFDNLIDWIHEKEIDQVFLPTAACKFLKQSGKEINPNIKILTGGDTLGNLDKVPFSLYNNYGPTEAVVVSTVFKVDKAYEDRQVPIGKPITNKEVYILDDQLNPMPVGFEGEIYIGGAGIARGYINNEELTNAVFISNPFGEGRLYKTGDTAKWLSDGNIEFIGRNDSQVNIRGLRIELGEIESNLLSHPLIHQVLINVYEVQEDEYLIAYFISDEVLEKNDLKDYLRGFLPTYMIPEHFIQLEKFPLTLNGKINKKALPTPQEISKSKYVAPRNESEVMMVEIWKKILDREEIGIEDNFFDIGGHSMKALQMVSRVNAEMDLRINLGNVISAPYIKDLVETIDNYQREYNNIVTLTDTAEKGDDVFFFPPLMGTSLAYMGIVKMLKDDFNCHGIQDNGFDFDEPFDKNLEDKAWNFARQIIKYRSQKKLTLIGFSLGASLAFETAKILEDKGFEIRLLIIDRNISRRKPKLTDEVIRANENELRYLEGWLRGFEYTEEQTVRIRKLWRNNIDLNNKYKQRGRIKGDIIAFKTKNNISNEFLNMKDWEKFTTGRFDHVYLQGNHYDAIQLTKNLEIIAQELIGAAIQQ